MRSALPAVIIACAATLLLGGCVPQEPVVVPPVEQQSEPVFASDEEALAAATDAYKAYLEMSDLIAQEGGKDPERIAPFVTEEWLEQELEGNKALAASGRHLVGSVKLTGSALQQIYLESGSTVIVIYSCVDPNGARVVTSDGDDVTPEILKSPTTTEASFLAESEGASLLLLKEEAWSSDSFC